MQQSAPLPDPATGQSPASPASERALAMDVRRLSKRYRLSSPQSKKDPHFWALKDVTFQLRQGDRLGVIGQNGAGKSTLLKILSRVINPTHGEAFINGRVASLLEVGTGFNQELTGRQNVYMNAALHGMSRAEIDACMQAIIDFSEIGHFIDEPVKTYSTGMRSRLGFSVAAHIDPDILMLDEVLSVGDAAFQQKCLGRMEELTGQGRTLLFVSHSISAVRRFCDQALWLEKGAVVQQGEAKQVCDDYESSMFHVSATYAAPLKARTDATPNVQSSPAQGASSLTLVAEKQDVTQLLSAKVVDTTGSPARALRIDQLGIIELVFDVFQPGCRVEPALHFKNEHGDILFVVAFTDPSRPDAFNKKGRYRVSARIPGNLLNEGLHFVTVALVTADPLLRHQVVERAIAFSVYELFGLDSQVARGRYARAFPGGLRPRFDWQSGEVDD